MTEALLTRKAVLLAKIESTYNTDPTPSALLDALLVEDPDYSIDLNVLERNFSRFDIDMLPHQAGRKLASMKFTHEWRSNGRTQSGSASDAAKLGRLLRACGFAQAAIAGTSGTQVGTINAAEANVSAPTWAAGGTWTALTMPVLYTIEVTTAGASGVAEVSITPDAKAVAAGIDAAQTDVVVTTATALQLKSGGSGATITPTFTGDLTLGDTWQVWVYPVGILYSPVSSGFESLTLYLYFDGLLHKMTGARGTFSLNCVAGEYGKAEFTFTGQYIAPIDAALPTTAVFERQKPAMIERSNLQLSTLAATVSAFGLEIGNNVVPRADANAADGYNGVRITARDVKGTLDPEATLVADFDFWGTLAAGTEMLYRNQVGQTAGNKIHTIAPCVQLANLGYQSRDDIRTMDTPLKLARKYGNDSVSFIFA